MRNRIIESFYNLFCAFVNFFLHFLRKIESHTHHCRDNTENISSESDDLKAIFSECLHFRFAPTSFGSNIHICRIFVRYSHIFKIHSILRIGMKEQILPG